MKFLLQEDLLTCAMTPGVAVALWMEGVKQMAQ